jgi:hypothetical protein
MTFKLFNLKNLIWFCAIGLAVCSGYYSIFGISKLFSGGSWSIIGMAAMLELSKLVVVSFLHDHFKTLKTIFKFYLMSAAVVLMAITSIGVYGYLTNSYQETAKVIYKTQNEITLLDQKKKLFEEQKVQLDKAVEDKNTRLKSLDQIRLSQQNAYTQQLTQKRGTGGLTKNIASVDKSSENLNSDISTLTQKSFALSDSIANIEQLKLSLSNETFSSELGPLLYLSRITGIPMDVVVNWFIIILVIVFDPLAVSLVIAANHLSSKEKQQETLDELSKIGQEIEINPPMEETDFFQNKVLEEEVKEPHTDVVIIKKKKKRNKSLKNKKESSILTNTPIESDVVEDNSGQKEFYGEEPKLEEVQVELIENPWIPSKPFRR